MLTAIGRSVGRTRKQRKTSVIYVAFFVLLGLMVFDRLYIAPKQDVRASEAVLKQDLYNMRTAIDQYTKDKGKAPQTLNDLVTAGYLRAIPKDPFTNSIDSWQVVQEEMLTPIEQTP